MSDHPSSVQLWKRLPEERRLQAADAFWSDEDAVEQQAEAITLLARRMNARPRFIQGLPPERKARYLAGYPGMPEILAARLLVAYHLAQQQPLLSTFLDGLGIEHQDGLITKDPETPPAPDRIAAVAQQLDERFPAEDVSIYLCTLLAQDPDAWAALADVPQVRRLGEA